MTILGRDIHNESPFVLIPEARARGTYVIGATGTGKTTLLQSIAYQDMLSGDGLCVLDPHGEMIDWLLERIPKNRENDVILFNPADTDWPVGLNLLQCNRSSSFEVRWVTSAIMTTLQRLFWYSWGPRLEHVLHHTIKTALVIPNSTFVELLMLLTDTDYRKKIIGSNKPYQDGDGFLLWKRDYLLINFWYDWFLKHNPSQISEITASTVNKLSPFLLDSMMRNIVGQAKNKFNMREIMNDGKILLVNLSKGAIGETNSSLLGSMIVNLILVSALARRQQKGELRPFHVIVDEYQNFAGESFSVLQSEARKYAVDLIVAHQFRDQLSQETKGSALNVGNFICFRVTGADGLELSRQFDNTPPPPDEIWKPLTEPTAFGDWLEATPTMGQMVDGPRRLYSDVMMEQANKLANLPPFEAAVRLIQKDENDEDKLVLKQYHLKTIHPDETKGDELTNPVYGSKSEALPLRLKTQTRANYARPRKEVEDEIFERIGNERWDMRSEVSDSGIID